MKFWCCPTLRIRERWCTGCDISRDSEWSVFIFTKFFIVLVSFPPDRYRFVCHHLSTLRPDLYFHFIASILFFRMTNSVATLARIFSLFLFCFVCVAERRACRSCGRRRSDGRHGCGTEPKLNVVERSLSFLQRSFSINSNFFCYVSTAARRLESVTNFKSVWMRPKPLPAHPEYIINTHSHKRTILNVHPICWTIWQRYGQETSRVASLKLTP